MQIENVCYSVIYDMKRVKEFILLYLNYFCYLRFLYFPFSQARAIRKMLKRASCDTDYYHDVIVQHGGNTSATSLDKMPILTKEIIRKESFRLFSKRLIGNQWCWLNTGGSTGEPLKFPFFRSLFSMQLENIAQMYLYKKMGYRIGDRIAAVDGRRVDGDSLRKNIFWGGQFF